MKLTKFIFIMLGLFMLLSCSGKEVNEVVVYTSEDQLFSEPILKDFEAKTGIKVKALFDTEETKSTGVVNRLIAEKERPQCDVFWSNDPVRPVVLKNKGITAPYVSPAAGGIPEKFIDPEHHWTGFSARVRVIMYNTKLVTEKNAPRSIFDYINPQWKGKTAIANPLFGTTTFQAAALFATLGDEKAKQFFKKLKENQVRIVSSNGETRHLVANGEVAFGLVDTDDAYMSVIDGKPVKMIYPDQQGIGALVVPNAVSMIKNCPHPENAKKLIDYLLSPEVEAKLAKMECAQLPLHPGVELPENLPPLDNIKSMDIDYAEVAKKLQEIQPFLKQWLGY